MQAAVKSSPTTVNSNGKPPNIIISTEQEKLNQSLSSKLDPEILEEENKELLINWNNSPVNPKLQWVIVLFGSIETILFPRKKSDKYLVH